MSFLSTNMGIRVWDLPDDDFDSDELANNWMAIDAHDHTTGKGLQIPTGGIQNLAVTSAKLAEMAVTTGKINTDAVTQAKIANAAVGTPELIDLNVTTAKLADGAVTGPKLADNSVSGSKLADASVTEPKLANNAVSTRTILDANVTEPKLATNAASTRVYQNASVTQQKLAQPAVDSTNIFPEAVTSGHLDPNIIPVGTVIAWYRPSDLTPLPTNWIVADGQSVADHDFAEGTPIVVPDMRNRFILGAVASGGGAGVGSSPTIGGTGGSHTLNLQHAHVVDSHAHVVNSHAHGIIDDSHSHLFWDDSFNVWRALQQRGSGVHLRAVDPYSTWRQNLYLPGLNSLLAENHEHDSGPIPMSTHVHSHGGSTVGASPGTSAVSPNTNNALSASQDSRPRHVGLIFLIKVKN